MDHFTNIRGPQKCPHACSVCHGEHHWLSETYDPEDDDETLAYREHLAAAAEQGTMYLQCKHCEAWHEITEAMLDDPDFCFA